MAVNATISAVTEKIIERSRNPRRRYLEKIDADAKLPHPSTLSNKRRAKKRLNADKAETESLDKTLRSEKQASKEKSWEHKQARLSKAKSFEERLAEYEARQKNLAKLEQSRSIQRL